ncbi:hypothetical protein [Acidocella sp.]|uniref:hypothetical protein n=1 Tax=Acidocella sp. TaxID=50710 RepID=UPI0026133335|nr:hypothetical protein [Acidocella sp.]
MSAPSQTAEQMLEKIEFLRERFARLDGLGIALEIMTRQASFESFIERRPDYFRTAVEQIGLLHGDVTTGCFDALEALEDFVSAGSANPG